MDRLDQYAAVNATRQQAAHRIAEISYSQDRLVCTCGASMRAEGAKDYPEHRQTVGVRPLSLSTAQGRR